MYPSLHYLIPACLLLLGLIGCAPSHTTATATIQLLNQQEVREIDTDDTSRMILEKNHIDIKVSIFNSRELLQNVAKELVTSGNTHAFLAPDGKNHTSDSIETILVKHRSVEAFEMSQLLHISYAHPDPEIAAVIANLFVEAFADHYESLVIEACRIEIEDLRDRAHQQIEYVETLELGIANEKEANGTSSETYKELLSELEFHEGFHQALVYRMSQIYIPGIAGREKISYVRVIERAVAPLR